MFLLYEEARIKLVQCDVCFCCRINKNKSVKKRTCGSDYLGLNPLWLRDGHHEGEVLWEVSPQGQQTKT